MQNRLKIALLCLTFLASCASNEPVRPYTEADYQRMEWEKKFRESPEFLRDTEEGRRIAAQRATQQDTDYAATPLPTRPNNPSSSPSDYSPCQHGGYIGADGRIACSAL